MRQSHYRFIIIVLFTISYILSNNYCTAQDNTVQFSKKKTDNKKILFSACSGISVPIRNEWQPNYLFSGSVFVKINDRLRAGLRLGYSHWLADQNYLTSGYPLDITWGDVTGTADIIEIIPSVRYILFSEYNKSNLFLQMGVGYYMMKGSWSLSGIYPDPVTSKADFVGANSSFDISKPGISFGCGIKAGFIEILPMYNIVFSTQTYQYLNVCVGIDF